MPGTKEGCKKAAETLKKKYGQDYFKKLGKKGALKALEKDPERLSKMGKKGGRKLAELLKENAKNGLEHQWKVARRIEKEYDEFFDSRICDYLAIKDRKLIFIEIKSPTDLRLRGKQKRFKEVVENLGFKYLLEC